MQYASPYELFGALFCKRKGRVICMLIKDVSSCSSGDHSKAYRCLLRPGLYSWTTFHSFSHSSHVTVRPSVMSSGAGVVSVLPQMQCTESSARLLSSIVSSLDSYPCIEYIAIVLYFVQLLKHR